MGFLYFMIYASIFVSALNAQNIGDDYPKWDGVLRPLIYNWNNKNRDRNDWISDDNYLSDNSIDGSDYNTNENTDYNAIKYYILSAQPRQPPQKQPTLSDLIRDNQLNEILGKYFPDGNGLTINGQTLDEFSKPSSSENVNLIPPALIASRPFRLDTLASIGYGPNFRFYR